MTLLAFAMTSPEPRSYVERKEDRQPHDIDEMPIERADGNCRVAERAEIIQCHPPRHDGEQDIADYHMRHVEAGDGEVQRSVGMRVDRERFALPLEHLDDDENDPEQQAETDAADGAQPRPFFDGVLSPPDRD